MAKTKFNITAHLRDRVISGLHRGRLRGGDRLPSFREVAEEVGVDFRLVSDAYKELEAEGLVEVRGRSGVYVAVQERIGGFLLSESAQWLAGVMAEAWKRQIAIPALPELLRRCTDASQLRCAFVESTEDHMLAFCAQLGPGFGLECVPVFLESELERSAPDRLAAVLEQLRKVDLVITTAFHAAYVHGITEALDSPLVVVTAIADIAKAIERRLRDGPLTVVCADPLFGERIRLVYGGEYKDRIHVVRADDRWEIARLDPTDPVLMTRAARRRLMDDVPLPLLIPHSPTLSFESARELSEVLIRINTAKLERE
ncbi:MAG: GntR family transcriptional regulator [Gemmatimonadetes bacterium]|nr:GntR family transcriptional regulator [Gemmatimonadota bacterium]